jgi:hypothetical protein
VSEVLLGGEEDIQGTCPNCFAVLRTVNFAISGSIFFAICFDAKEKIWVWVLGFYCNEKRSDRSKTHPQKTQSSLFPQ